MKKITLSIIALVAIVCLSSCDSKICVCYQPVNGVMTMSDTYTSTDVRCNSLSTTTRTCVEESERVDPGDIANPFKQQQ